MKNFLLILMLAVASISLGQSKFIVFGSVSNDDMNRREGDVTVTVTSNGSTVTSTVTSNSGKFKLLLDYGKKYKVEFSKGGLVERHLIVDLVGINEEDLPAGDLMQEMEMTLYGPVPGVDMSFFKNEPTTTFTVNMKKGMPVMDTKQASLVRSKIDAMLEQKEKLGDQSAAINKQYDDAMAAGDNNMTLKKYADALKNYQEAEKLKPTETLPKTKIEEAKKKLKEEEEAKKLAENEAKYNESIAAADKFFVAKEWDKALGKYEEALGYKANDKHATERVIAIDEILSEQRRKELEDRQKNEEYYNLIKAADNLRDQKNYDKAISTYEEAIAKKGDEQYPKDQVKAIRKLVEEQAAQEQLEKDYQAAMSAAKTLFDNKDYEASKAKYSEALGLKPAEKEPKDKIAEIDDILKNLANQEAIDKAYNEAMAKANGLFDAGKWKESIVEFQNALKVKEKEQEPKDKIAQAEAKIKEAEELANLEENYAKKIQDADKLFADQKLDQALSVYNEALTLKPGEKHPTDRIAEIQKTIAENSQAAELQKQYDAAMNEANVLFGAKKYQEAKSKFEAAAQLKPSEALPKEKIAEIESLLSSMAEQEELEKNYSKLITDGASAMQAGDLTTAKTKYQEANGLKPAESLPKEKIQEIDKLLQEQAANAQQTAAYNSLITEADALFNSANYEQAKGKYQEALAIKSEAHPTQRITEIDKLIKELAEQAAKEKAYQDKIASADQLFASTKLPEAIKAYEEALQIDATQDYPKNQIKLINDKIAESQSAAEKEAKFNQLVAEGDQLASSTKLNEAIAKYQEALSYKNDDGVKSKIDAINKQIEEAAAASLKESSYQEALGKAQGFEVATNYAQAIAEYQKASGIKPEENLPKEKIKALSELMQNQSAEQALNDQINALVSAGDNKLNAGDFQGAKEKYEEALALRQDASIVQKIADVEARMKAETEDQVAKNYQKIIDKADQLKNAKDYDNAISYYERALTIKPGDSYPTQKINEIRQEIEAQKQQEAQSAQVDAEYQAALKQGDTKMASNDLSGALEAYVKAKNLKPNESLPNQKIEQVNNLMANKMNEEKDLQEYKKLMTEGNKFVDARNYEEALKSFDKALSIKPGDMPAQTRKNEVQALIDANKNAEQNQKYAEWIGQGNKAFNEQDYEVAKIAYNEALKVKPNDKIASDRVDEINKILENIANNKLKEAETEQAYRKVITKADTKYVKEDWKDAQKLYEEALVIRPGDKYAKDQLNATIHKQRLESEKEAEEQYRKIVKKGDEFFGDENWEKAKSMYERALSLRANDNYPKEKIAEIERIIANGGKMPVKLEELGKRENISIIDGEALFVKAEQTRKAKRNLKVKELDEDIERKDVEKYTSDEMERLAARMVVTDIEREKAAIEADKGEDQLGMSLVVEDLNKKTELKTAEDNLFEYAERLRNEAYTRQVVIEKEVIATEKKHIPKANEAVIKGTAYQIEQRLRSDAMDETKLVQDTRSLVVTIEDKHEGFQKEDARVIAANDVAIKGMKKDLKTKSDEELVREYDNVQRIIANLEEVSKQKTAADEDLLLITKDIDEKVTRVNKEIGDRVRENALTDYDAIKAIEAHIINVDRDVAEDNVTRDMDRQENVETVKELMVRDSDVATQRAQDKKEDSYSIKSKVVDIEDSHREAVSDRSEERTEMVQTVKKLDEKQEDHTTQKTDQKTKDIYQTKKSVSNIEEGVSKSTDESGSKQLVNNELIKDVKMDLEDKSTEEFERDKKKQLDMKKLLDDLDSKGVRFSESIANTLAEEFPEGVTEQNFTISDDDGLLIEMKTRRIVVKNGRGDVYVRSSSKYGTTYTKNGEAVTEYVWQRDTQDAKLVRHKTN